MIAQIVQCGIACVVGCAVYWSLYPDPNPKVPLVGALICGFAAPWFLTKLWVLICYGRKAAKSMTLDP